MPSADSLWYRDAVFYELHVKAFQDSNGDGVGDFRGLTSRLDYLQNLGVDCIWLLPFYPSPLRDDGYDIAEYYGVHPAYGSLDDFQRFLDEAHARGLRVIADLVLNHTSSDHSWFQRARHAPRGSLERDFYVWSDSDEVYGDARIIFTDTEPSNWTWDPVAGQYYWHRFFAHQPDLNWDNPAVKEAMFDVMEFWLERGLDGFRCDAVPYLIEREGTICENLPETHEILKEFRRRLDERYPDRILLAEANQWPDDVRPYFGDGDEFHMAFHFPVMPRLFMAVRQGVWKPIVDIIQRTPPIPEGCQWCMFLRNHDELTLEMVTDEERDYMYNEYAADPRMRLNLGIRRRLAPLMDNDRRRIELLNSILFTLPGSPIVYYGDEMGMGDNIYLGDRDGVRTPMQWSPDRNAGFSRAEAARLYAPVITDSVYGYQAINVEAQERSPFSLLNWMKRLIEVRKQHRAFGRGSIEFLRPVSPHVLAYLREYDGKAILVVNNLSAAAQAVQLDLSRFAGLVPVEMLGHTEFPTISETPYALTLSPYSFFWFALLPPRTGEEEIDERLAREWAEHDAALLERRAAVQTLVTAISPEWLQAQRWFRAKAREIAGLALEDHAIIAPERGPRWILALVRVQYTDGGHDSYVLPLSVRPPMERGVVAEPILTVALESGEVHLYEALLDRSTAFSLLRLMREEDECRATEGGVFAGHRGSLADQEGGRLTPVRRGSAEQSNTSIVFGDRIILKLFRRAERGTNSDIEITRFLVRSARFRAVPPLAGWIDYLSPEGECVSIAGAFQYIPNVGDAWAFTHRALKRYFTSASRSAADPNSAAGRDATRRMTGDFYAAARSLGRVTGEMHVALASAGPDRPEFVPEPIGADEAERWVAAAQASMTRVLEDVGLHLETMPGAFPTAVQNELSAVLHAAADLRFHLSGLLGLAAAGVTRIRIHGDYHLGQVLRASDPEAAGSEWFVMDFEGEPARPLEERRAKSSPLRDVAGMLRSFDYALATALEEQDRSRVTARASLEEWGGAWLRLIRKTFLDAYLDATRGASFIPDDRETLERVLRAFELEKAVYELGYEMNNRPDWIWVPVQGLRAILGSEE
ncbi:MAG TPA: maltose alpha-D-glucosyltransferase [Longimicrobiaceae bacterium]|nr:maltose alpha-D-glucosyltransferase [Longimicrobiaceae bacterium]